MNDNKDLMILLIDDEPDILDTLKSLIESFGYTPLLANSPTEANDLLALHHSKIILILSDFKMPEMNGLEFRAQMFEEWKQIPFAILSGFVTKEMALQGVQYKICAFLDKPFDENEIKKLVETEARERMETIREEKELLDGFVEDANNLLEELEPLLLDIENHPGDIESLNRVYAIVHTIKGASGFFDSTINKYAHRYEDLLTKLKDGALSATPEIVTVLLRAFDCLGKLIQTIREPANRNFNLDEELKVFDLSEAANSTAVDPLGAKSDGKDLDANAPKAPKAKDWVKVSTTMLDEFMEFSGELTVIRNMVNKLVQTIEKTVTGNRDVAQLGDLLEEMHKINSTMQDKIIDLRKQPIKDSFRPLPRLVRDLCGTLNKEIKLELKGEELRIDTAISEVLSSSLVHLIRNCADHGIETPDMREQRNKPRTGTIVVQGMEKGEDIVVEIQDDGSGIDPEKIKARLREKKLFPDEEIELMSEARLYTMIFESGFSTAAAVTSVSGRGVGMDMVRGSVEKLGGRIHIDSKLGVGTKMSLQMPVPKSVLIISSLFVESGGEIFAIPQDHINRLVRCQVDSTETQILKLEGTEVLKISGKLIPLVRVNNLLNLNTSAINSGETNIVVVQAKGTEYGLVVDGILNVEDAVVKSLGTHLSELSTYAGATFLGDGKVGLILDVENIAQIAELGTNTADEVSHEAEWAQSAGHDRKDYLLFELEAPGLFGAYLEEIFRLEEFSARNIQYSGTQPLIVYRDQTMPIISLEKVLGFDIPEVKEQKSSEKLPVLVVKKGEKFFGLSIKCITDVKFGADSIDSSVRVNPNLQGTVYIDNKTISVLSVKQVLRHQEEAFRLN